MGRLFPQPRRISQEELFKLATITRPVDSLPFIFLLACFPPPWDHLQKKKEQTDVPGPCCWEIRGTSELLVSLQRHPAGNHDSQLGHKGLAINLGRWWIFKTFANVKKKRGGVGREWIYMKERENCSSSLPLLLLSVVLGKRGYKVMVRKWLPCPLSSQQQASFQPFFLHAYLKKRWDRRKSTRLVLSRA